MPGSGPRYTVVTLGLLVVIVVTALVVFLPDEPVLRYAENLILRQHARSSSRWRIVETAEGRLIQATSGPFAGWYLAADELVDAMEPPDASGPRIIAGWIANDRRTARNLILRHQPGDDCLWRFVETENGQRIAPARGRYEGWLLGYQERYVPDRDSDSPSAWNLVLEQRDDDRLSWKLTGAGPTYLVQPTFGTFRDWYLDCLEKARIVERDLRDPDPPRRSGPTPPLAPAD